MLQVQTMSPLLCPLCSCDSCGSFQGGGGRGSDWRFPEVGDPASCRQAASIAMPGPRLLTRGLRHAAWRREQQRVLGTARRAAAKIRAGRRHPGSLVVVFNRCMLTFRLGSILGRALP